MNNSTTPKLRLDLAVMPLIEVIICAELSWDQREKVASAIRETVRHWRDLEREAGDTAQCRAVGGAAPSQEYPRTEKCDHSHPHIHPTSTLGPAVLGVNTQRRCYVCGQVVEPFL